MVASVLSGWDAGTHSAVGCGTHRFLSIVECIELCAVGARGNHRRALTLGGVGARHGLVRHLVAVVLLEVLRIRLNRFSMHCGGCIRDSL